MKKAPLTLTYINLSYSAMVKAPQLNKREVSMMKLELQENTSLYEFLANFNQIHYSVNNSIIQNIL